MIPLSTTTGPIRPSCFRRRPEVPDGPSGFPGRGGPFLAGACTPSGVPDSLPTFDPGARPPLQPGEPGRVPPRGTTAQTSPFLRVGPRLRHLPGGLHPWEENRRRPGPGGTLICGFLASQVQSQTRVSRGLPIQFPGVSAEAGVRGSSSSRSGPVADDPRSPTPVSVARGAHLAECPRRRLHSGVPVSVRRPGSSRTISSLHCNRDEREAQEAPVLRFRVTATSEEENGSLPEPVRRA